MSAPAAASEFEATLANLTAFGMQLAEAVSQCAVVERKVAELAATWLPAPGHEAATLTDAATAGRDIDAVAAVLAATVPRLDILSRAYERISRSVRRTVALHRRLQTGWPRASTPDNRAAMQKRQVAKGVGDRIRTETDEDAAEDLFADLNECLDDPDLDEELKASSVTEVVERICRDIGVAAVRPMAPKSPETVDPTPAPPDACPAHPPDTG